jgi:cytochrome c-type biogenesis protein CcsB
MGVNPGLSHLSDLFIYSAMVAYMVAFIAFVTDLSGLGSLASTAETVGDTLDLAKLNQTVLDPALMPVGAGAGGGDGERSGPPRVPTDGGKPVQSEVTERRRPALGIALAVTYLAFGLHLAGVVARGLSVHRAPWGNMYEFSISGTLVVTGVYLVVLLRQDLRFLGTFVIGPVLLSLGLATTVLYTQAGQLLPALQSFWLVIHVSVAFIASALFTLGFSLTVVQLVQDRRESLRASGKAVIRGRFMDALPSSAELETSAYRVHAIAFPLWSFTLIAGAIWAEKAWSRYWNWDPKEVWSFVIWVVYAAYLHARATRGWRGRGAAYLAIAGFGCILFNYLVVNFFFIGLHAYSGVG